MDRRYLIERDQFPLNDWWAEAHRLRDQAGGSLDKAPELRLIFGMLNAITHSNNANPHFNPVPRHTEMITLGNERVEVIDARFYPHPCQRVMLNNGEPDATLSRDGIKAYCFSCPLKNPAPHVSVSIYTDFFDYNSKSYVSGHLMHEVIERVCKCCALLNPDLRYKEEDSHV